MADKPFACPRCPRRFSTEQGARAHRREVHPSKSRRASRDRYRAALAEQGADESAWETEVRERYGIKPGEAPRG